MDFAKQIEYNRRLLVEDIFRRLEAALQPVVDALNDFFAVLFSRRLPADWREQWHALIAEQEAAGYRVAPVSVQEFEDWIEAWARYCELLPVAETRTLAPAPAVTEQPPISRRTSPSFGNQSGNTPIQFGFTGRDWDPETGLQYNRARYYDPTIGRWIGQDPNRFNADDTNLYRFVGNEPTDLIDPNGEQEQGKFRVTMYPQTESAPGSPLSLVTTAQIKWKPDDDDPNECGACKKVGLFQIADTYQVTKGHIWGQTIYVNPWHYDDIRQGGPDHPTVVDYNGGGEAFVEDHPGIHRASTRARVLTLTQKFETGAICLDKNSPHYLKVFGVVVWTSSYIRPDLSSKFVIDMGIETGSNAYGLPQQQTSPHFTLQTQWDVGMAPSTNFMTKVGAKLGGVLKW